MKVTAFQREHTDTHTHAHTPRTLQKQGEEGKKRDDEKEKKKFFFMNLNSQSCTTDN